jgi:hypothetical protein
MVAGLAEIPDGIARAGLVFHAIAATPRAFRTLRSVDTVALFGIPPARLFLSSTLHQAAQ